MSSASTADQEVRETSLAQLGEAAAESSAPAMLVIGEIVRLRAGMDWLGAMTGRALEPEPLGKTRLRDAG